MGTIGKAVSNSDIDIDSFVTHLLNSFNLSEVDTLHQTDIDKELVDRVIMVYNLLSRKFAQLDNTKGVISGSKNRPDLRAGVEIGDIFYFRFEMCLVGLHTPTIAGIDFINVQISRNEEPVAVSIVSASLYEDQEDDGEVLIYSGQGGAERKDKPQTDQELVRVNLRGTHKLKKKDVHKLFDEIS
ncbi:hypothetical protein L2E82_31156 [Cichorium intybus]|uniref:Uncharacterized protein n=1 Tax=Cichorium intybus TaxID=13427 RepID=A0ACB9D2F3_CICIN|nr:hypothetical protein L2E82_31156 [Cichorium intybus]